MIAVPNIVKKYYSDLLWKVETDKKELFLTFDDGPTPEITPWVLDQLKSFDAKATFFCIGKNINENPEIYDRIIKEGHAVGNHTHDHKNGWSTNTFGYLRSVLLCDEITGSKLFRPPYGRIKKSQIKALKHRFKIIMWDVLSEDYNEAMKPEDCLKNVTNTAKKGSIIVFHDSEKASLNLKGCLPQALEILTKKGFCFSSLSFRSAIS